MPACNGNLLRKVWDMSTTDEAVILLQGATALPSMLCPGKDYLAVKMRIEARPMLSALNPILRLSVRQSISYQLVEDIRLIHSI